VKDSFTFSIGDYAMALGASFKTAPTVLQGALGGSLSLMFP
jgi:hypothetical protein